VSDDGAMSGTMPPESLVAGPGFPRLALGLAWLGSSLGAGVLGWIIGGVPGRLLLGGAVLGLVATGAVVSNRHKNVTLGFSALASMMVIAIGIAAAVIVAINGDLGTARAAAIGAVPVVGGVQPAIEPSCTEDRRGALPDQNHPSLVHCRARSPTGRRSQLWAATRTAATSLASTSPATAGRQTTPDRRRKAAAFHPPSPPDPPGRP
jgi:hypothetical protein